MELILYLQEDSYNISVDPMVSNDGVLTTIFSQVIFTSLNTGGQISFVN